jgi:hypothetical protein
MLDSRYRHRCICDMPQHRRLREIILITLSPPDDNPYKTLRNRYDELGGQVELEILAARALIHGLNQNGAVPLRKDASQTINKQHQVMPISVALTVLAAVLGLGRRGRRPRWNAGRHLAGRNRPSHHRVQSDGAAVAAQGTAARRSRRRTVNDLRQPHRKAGENAARRRLGWRVASRADLGRIDKAVCSRPRHLPLAVSHRVGHIQPTGAVAEWLKAAVC